MAKITFNYQPFVVFVKGQGDCCYSSSLANNLSELGCEVWIVPWNSFTRSNESDHPADDAKFLAEGEDTLENVVGLERPVILVGHSFGGDSILKLLPRLNRRIALAGVIDPVSTFGLRAPLVEFLVPEAVLFFFNRWQTNRPWPIDFSNRGELVNVQAQVNDQKEQNFWRLSNGSEIRRSCGFGEFCKGERSLLQYLGDVVTDDYGSAARRLYHEDMVDDELIKSELLAQILKATALYNSQDEQEKKWIADQYPKILNRPGTQFEIDDAHQRWRQGRSREDFHRSLIYTDEATNLIVKVYREILERPPFPYELEYERSYLWIGYRLHCRNGVAENAKILLSNLYRDMIEVKSPVGYSYDWDGSPWKSTPIQFLKRGGAMENVREEFRSLITKINTIYKENLSRSVVLEELQRHTYDLVTINRDSATKSRWTLDDVRRQIRGEIVPPLTASHVEYTVGNAVQRETIVKSLVETDSIFALLGQKWPTLSKETKSLVLQIINVSGEDDEPQNS